MASTNFTTHYEIPLPLGTDLTTPMDYNTSMEAVDTALFGAVTDADQAATLASQANDTANAASSAAGDVAADLTLEKAKIVALQTRMTNAENEIDDVRADGQDSICAYNEPTATSTHHYNIGEYFFYNDTLYTATAEININDTITPNTNCDTTTITAELLNKIGNLASLTTTDKNSCVDAINEIHAALPVIIQATGTFDSSGVYTFNNAAITTGSKIFVNRVGGNTTIITAGVPTSGSVELKAWDTVGHAATGDLTFNLAIFN